MALFKIRSKTLHAIEASIKGLLHVGASISITNIYTDMVSCISVIEVYQVTDLIDPPKIGVNLCLCSPFLCVHTFSLLLPILPIYRSHALTWICEVNLLS